MPTPLVLILPAADADLRDEVVQRLSPIADVNVQQPQALGLDMNQVKLIVEIAVGAATFIKTLLEIRKMMIDTGKASGITVGALGGQQVALEAADEAFLRSLLDEQP